MSEPTPVNHAASHVHDHLHTIAQLLRAVPRLPPEAQQPLAELMEELSRALETEAALPADLAELAGHVSRLVQAAQAGTPTPPGGLVEQLRGRAESAAAAVETRAPLVAGLTRRLVEALAELGI